MEDKHYIASIISVLIGSGLLIWRKLFAAAVVGEQNRMWGFRFGDREERMSVIAVIIAGSGFLAIGILSLLGFIHCKRSF
jgi:hypothetical protein